MIVELTLTYRSGGVLQFDHITDFFEALSLALIDSGHSATLRGFRTEQARSGMRYWVVLLELPRGYRLFYPDKVGIWPHGMSSVARLRGQVAADAAGWSAGLYARWPIRVPPEFPTQSRFSAPDAFLGCSQ